MHTYETLFITPPTLTEAEEQEAIDALLKIVHDGGGTVTAHDRMGRRRLAYPLDKHVDGVYVRFLYDAEPAVPKELERRARISDRVLRSLTVRLEPNWAVAAKEQAVRDAQFRAEAAERDRLRAEQGDLEPAPPPSGGSLSWTGGFVEAAEADERDPDDDDDR